MEERPVSEIIRHLLAGVSGLVRSEIRLAKAEMTHSMKDAGKQVGRAAAGSAVAILGVLCFVTFLVVGLGAWIGNYWLSALIFAVLFLAIGGGQAYRSIRRLQTVDASLTNFRRSVDDDRDLIVQKIQEVKEARGAPEPLELEQRTAS